MLSVDQRSPVERFADLKQFAVSILADGGRVETEHARQRQTAARSVAARHAHPPVRHDEFIATARATLVIEVRKDDPVPHELPPGGHRHVHRRVFVLIRRVLRPDDVRHRTHRDPRRQCHDDVAPTKNHDGTPSTRHTSCA